MKCFYHTDLDGECAGAIVKKWWDEEVRLLSDGITLEPYKFIPIDYKDEFPFDTIVPNEKIFIVDYSLKREAFDRLLSITNDVIWIDHHKSAIEECGDLKLKGIRRIGTAGCVLTWQYFYVEPIPIVVKMLGAYDIWDFSTYGEYLNYLQTGMGLHDTAPDKLIWNDFLKEHPKPLTDILDQGIIALNYRDNRNATLVKSFAFYSEFEGYRAICCNAGLTNSQLFDSIPKDAHDFDLMMPFIFDGKQWKFSIYTRKDIDCSELAKKYGGGGHAKAAGFQSITFPLRRINNL